MCLMLNMLLRLEYIKYFPTYVKNDRSVIRERYI